jgi:hypothetical protein
MDDANDHAPLEPRLPDTDDLVFLCRRLNEAGAKYMVVGGFAIIQHGFARATEDVDLLIDVSPENLERVRAAMVALPDGAVREVSADDFVVDLMRQACGIEYAEASREVTVMSVQEVPIPFASPRLLLRMKQTYRSKDEPDRAFLQTLLGQEQP